eukprot:7070137-Prymnesium_polylepis.1
MDGRRRVSGRSGGRGAAGVSSRVERVKPPNPADLATPHSTSSTTLSICEVTGGNQGTHAHCTRTSMMHTLYSHTDQVIRACLS